MARLAKSDVRRIALAVVGMAAALMLSACNSTPDTYFDWGLQDAPVRTARSPDVKPMSRPGGRKRYVYRDAASREPQPIARPASTSPDNCVAPVASADPAPMPSPAKPAAVHALHFSWPVRGKVISGFGVQAGGERNDGINIAAVPETPIRASANGIVGYIGSEIGGYGNIMLIRHEGDYVTTYAHARRFVVQKGDYVRAGDIIGYTGESGDVSTPQLHFEIRRGVTPLNPIRMLASNS